MKIGALASSLRKPLPATLKLYSEMGLQGIQLLMTPEILTATDERLSEIRALCDRNSLAIPAVCGDIASTRFSVSEEWRDRVAVHARVVDAALKLGAHIITTHIGVVPGDKNDPTYPVMLESIRAAAEYSASKGAVLAVETGPETPVILGAFLDDVGSKGIGVNLDPANLRMVSCVDAAHAVKILGKYIVHTHAKDGINLVRGSAAACYGVVEPDGSRRVISDTPAKYREVPLGDGQVEWDSYLAALKEIGYDGFLTIERECGEDPARDIKKAFDFLKNKIS